MAQKNPSLEDLAGNSNFSSGIMPGGCCEPMLKSLPIRLILDKIKDSKRREELRKEIGYVLNQYIEDLQSQNPTTRRATALEQAYGQISDIPEKELENPEDAVNVLRQRLYGAPGRNYSYMNSIAGNGKSKKELGKRVAGALGDVVKEGWPVIGAGAGWALANNWYKKELAKGLLKRAGGTLANTRWYEWLIPGGTLGKVIGNEAKLKLIGEALTPLGYAIGAYAVYKTIKYFLKKRKEKKISEEENKLLEQARNQMLLQRQQFSPQLEMQLQEAA